MYLFTQFLVCIFAREFSSDHFYRKQKPYTFKYSFMKWFFWQNITATIRFSRNGNRPSNVIQLFYSSIEYSLAAALYFHTLRRQNKWESHNLYARIETSWTFSEFDFYNAYNLKFHSYTYFILECARFYCFLMVFFFFFFWLPSCRSLSIQFHFIFRSTANREKEREKKQEQIFHFSKWQTKWKKPS